VLRTILRTAVISLQYLLVGFYNQGVCLLCGTNSIPEYNPGYF